MKGFKHLTLEDREKIFLWNEFDISYREMGRRLRKDHKAISVEIKKNTKYGRKYIPCLAQRRADRVGQRQRTKAPLKNVEIFVYVRARLRSPYFWTPEMISGHIHYDIKGASINKETIYRYIYSKKARKYKLWELLPCGRKKRMKKMGRKIRNRGKVPNAVSIDSRPKIIARRTQAGHWETDNIESNKSSKSALSVNVERKIRIVSMKKIPNQTAVEKTKALNETLEPYPQELRLSITQDNGKENYGHEETSKLLGTDMYFCHAYHSWEKGTVENRNKIIRRFFPKGTDFSRVSDKKIQFVESIINNMPLKCLRYLSAYEKMQSVLNTIQST